MAGGDDPVGAGDHRYRPDPDWGALPAGWSYVEVAGVAADSQDNVYVFNRGEHPVIVFDRDGTFLRSWGEGTIERAHGIYITADDRLFLTDDKDHTVTEYTLSGERVMTMGVSGRPSDTGVAGMDYRTIAQAGRTVQPADQPGRGRRRPPVRHRRLRQRAGALRSHRPATTCSPGALPVPRPGEFNLPHGIDVDSSGRVFVADRENSRLQLFDAEGRFLEEWPDIVRPTDLFICDDDTVFVAEEGARCGLFPWMTPDPDAIGGRVAVFAPDGELLARWGGGLDPCSPGDFYAPHGIWLDSKRTIYVGEVNWSAGGKDGDIPPDCPCLRRYVKM